jgi:Zn-dependent peptidase ImmA (M78 family)
VSAPDLHSGERAAREARLRLGLGKTEPIADLLVIVEDKLNVPVLIDRFDAEDIAGVLLRVAEGDAFVAINADHHPVRQRFTLAHEVGHILLAHQPRVERSADLFGPTRNPQEVETNYFAAELLAPRVALLNWLEEHGARANVDARAVVRLALEFGIAFPTACYRLERAGAVSPREKKRLVEETRLLGRQLADHFEHHRLRDCLEALWRERGYPRAPRQTVAYAAQAHDEGLIDEQTYRAIVPASTASVADWFA